MLINLKLKNKVLYNNKIQITNCKNNDTQKISFKLLLIASLKDIFFETLKEIYYET